MITGELKSQIDQIWNTFWTGGISNTITIVEQLTYLIFIKDLDETETRNERMSKRLNKQFTPIFGTDQQGFRWKNLKEMDVNSIDTESTSIKPCLTERNSMRPCCGLLL